jgi:hypothetical protein
MYCPRSCGSGGGPGAKGPAQDALISPRLSA